ncbi:MAG: PilT/PilU family type 4a pilus ATPase [Planctomycetes bacterium]|nr:PilT/PilU family type 4a pilus ATPase [Planctomycetota bacterium]
MRGSWGVRVGIRFPSSADRRRAAVARVPWQDRASPAPDAAAEASPSWTHPSLPDRRQAASLPHATGSASARASSISFAASPIRATSGTASPASPTCTSSWGSRRPTGSTPSSRGSPERSHSPTAIEDLVFPLLAPAVVEKLRSGAAQDADAGFEWQEERLSFRINVFRDRRGMACALRVLPRAIPDVESIGFPTERVWKDVVGLEQGLVIVTGITGSGKSTTVASLLQRIDQTQKVRIITLEDPIEYVFEGSKALISQREVGRHVPSFHSGLRSALREDPDIIFVGEMRDPETTSLALTAAETGHLVFSTLHTKDSVGVLSRIVDLFPPERAKELCTQLSFSLTQVLAQKLVPRAGGPGRRVAMEVFKNLPSVANLIRTGNWHQIYTQMQTQRKEGLITLERHLEDLVEGGEITRETALRYSSRAESR